ncbi:MAG: hypothetical protein KKB34_08310 [Bacteroidetes bacterium]|nr:hypothetical protein [Bacteroidota bacterium]
MRITLEIGGDFLIIISLDRATVLTLKMSEKDFIIKNLIPIYNPIISI